MYSLYLVIASLWHPSVPPRSQVTALENVLHQLTGEFHGALTGCERILRTPCPPGYVGVLRLSIAFFLLLIPFVLLEAGYMLIPIVFCSARSSHRP